MRIHAACNDDVLLAVDGVADDAAARARTHVEIPQDLAGIGVVGVQGAEHIGVEHQATRGGHHAAQARHAVGHAPLHLAGFRIARFEAAGGRFVRRSDHLHGLDAVVQVRRPKLVRILLRGLHRVAGFHHVVVPEACLRAEGAVVPAARTEDPGADQDFLSDLRVLAADQLAGLRVDRLHEVVGLAVRPHVVQLARLALHDPDEARLGRMEQQLLAAALEQHRLVRRVEIPDVVRQFLGRPLQFAGVGIQRDHRVGVQVVALAFVAEVIRRGIADAPVQGVGFRVVGAGQPAAAAAGIAGVAGPAVRIVLDGVELPLRRAGVRIERIDLAALRGVAGRRCNDEHIARQGRRRSEVVARLLARLHDLGLPDFLARLLVQRDQPAVQRREIDLAVANGHAAARRREEDLVDDRVELGLVAPELLAGCGVERLHLVVRGRVIEHAVDDDRRGLQPAGDFAGLMDPGDLELLDVRLVDAVERAVAARLPVAVINRPVRRVLVGCECGADRRCEGDKAASRGAKKVNGFCFRAARSDGRGKS